MTNLEFPRPKDPLDSGLYAIHSSEPISSIERVAVSAIGPTATQGVWRTPGDVIAGSPLTASGWTVTSDGMGVEFRLQGGAPGIAYAIRAAFTTASGSFVNRSAVLRVTGL